MFFAKVLAPLALVASAFAAPQPVSEPPTTDVSKRVDGDLTKKSDFWGQATYYWTQTGNQGACGSWLSDDKWTVALNSDQYYWPNMCWKGIWICNNDNGICGGAQIVDECPTCSYGSLDLSPSLFSHLTNGNMDQGVFTVHWGYD